MHIVATYVYLCYSLGTRLRTCASAWNDVYSKPKDSLPDPKGSLSSRLSSQAIALAIKEVEKVTNSEKGIKHGSQTSKGSSDWIAESMTIKHSILLDWRLSRVQKNKRDKFSQLYESWNFISWILQHKNLPIYGTCIYRPYSLLSRWTDVHTGKHESRESNYRTSCTLHAGVHAVSINNNNNKTISACY